MFNESKLVIANNKIIDYGSGTPTNVEFDFNVIWKYIKEKKSKGIIELNFYHTHPGGMLEYSELDRQMFKGYTIALGKKFVCTFIIVCFDDNSDINSMDCNWIGYYYNKKNNNIVAIEDDTDYYYGIDDAILKLLKIASCGGLFFET